MIMMAMMTVTIGIISLNVSQVKFSENEVKRLKSEMLAHGLMAYVFANQISPSAQPTVTMNTPLDGITYGMTAVITPAPWSNATSEADPLVIQVTY